MNKNKPIATIEFGEKHIPPLVTKESVSREPITKKVDDGVYKDEGSFKIPLEYPYANSRKIKNASYSGASGIDGVLIKGVRPVDHFPFFMPDKMVEDCVSRGRKLLSFGQTRQGYLYMVTAPKPQG